MAFRLLAHAEIESYLEDIVIATIDIATDNWLKNGLISKPLLTMIAFTEGELGRLPHSKSWDNILSLNTRIKNSKKKYSRYVVKENHGIKEWHILRLLLPAGIDENENRRIFGYRLLVHSHRNAEGKHTHPEVYHIS